MDLFCLQMREVFEEATQPLRKVCRYPAIVLNRVGEAGRGVPSANGLIHVKHITQLRPRVRIANEAS